MDPLLAAADLRFKLRGAPAQPRALGSPRSSSSQLQPSTDVFAQNEFKRLVEEHGLLAMADESSSAALKARCAEERLELERKIQDAREQHGQVEIVEAQLAVVSHAMRTSTKQDVDVLFAECELQSLSSGKKIDAQLERARFGLAWEEFAFARRALDESAQLLVLGGDWDRRNRLRVYAGLYSMCSRDFGKSSGEFLSGVATFTAEELFSYDRFVMYTMLVSVVALDRVQLQRQIVQSPEIIAVLDSCYQTQSSAYQQLSALARQDKERCAAVAKLVDALHQCDYARFMRQLLVVHDEVLQQDRYLARHAQWFLREMRTLAYGQFLASYKSVKLDHMASAFEVSAQFMDHELARFIASKRLSAKIDKVAGVVETNRPDLVNQKYQQVIKQGDLLLTRVQKLSRAVNV